MKKILYCLLLPCFFLLGNVSFAHSSGQVMDGGVEAFIYGKVGEVASFQVPDTYVNKDGNLMLPLEISLGLKDGNAPIFSTTSKDLSINLPSHLTGTYYVEIHIGNFTCHRKITL